MDNVIQESIKRRRIVELLIKYPDREFTVNELSKISKIPYATTWRFVQKLDKAGIVFSKTIGHSTVCQLNKLTPFLHEIKKVLEAKPTPQKTVIKEFVNSMRFVKGVKKIIVFGSVARDEEKLTSDIDVAVVVNRKNKTIESKITEIIDRILKKSKMKVIPLIMTEREVRENKQFADELKRGKAIYERSKRS